MARRFASWRQWPLGGASEHWYESPWRIAVRAMGAALAIIAIALVCALFVIPRLLGGSSLTVLTGSMEPTLMPGDIAVVRGVDQDNVCTSISVGDIVTYLPEPDDPALITHRVVGKTIGNYKDGTDCRLIFQGDNNSAQDDPVSPLQVRGTFMYGVPKLGWLKQGLLDHRGPALVVVVLLVLVYWGWESLRPPRTRVVTLGGPGHPPAPSTPTHGPVSGDHEPDSELAARGLALRVRELEVRVRELAVREAELALRKHPNMAAEAAASSKESG